MNAAEREALSKLYWELEGVVIDADERGYDDVCRQTIKRVQAEISKLSKSLNEPVSPPGSFKGIQE